MISPELSNYRFVLSYYNSQYQLIAQTDIPLKYISVYAKQLTLKVLPDEKNILKEPWFTVIPEVNISEQDLIRVNIPDLPFNLNGKPYQRPELLTRLVHSDPQAIIKWLRFEVHDMDKTVFEAHISTEDFFIYLIDYLADALIRKQLSATSQYYYDLGFAYNDSSEDSYLIVSENAINMADVFEVPKLEHDRKRLIFNKIKSTILPSLPIGLIPKKLNFGRGKILENRIIVNEDIRDLLCKELKLSRTEENGGYLIGNVYRQNETEVSEDQENFRWVVEVTEIVPAESAFGNSLLLLFTSETWSRLNQKLDQDFPNKKLVGWYHTHLFPGSDDFGLSELDQALHKQFYTKSWQIALLLNIDYDGTRELRGFQKNSKNNRLIESRYEIFEQNL